jgi:hypothetical protein
MVLLLHNIWFSNIRKFIITEEEVRTRDGSGVINVFSSPMGTPLKKEEKKGIRRTGRTMFRSPACFGACFRGPLPSKAVIEARLAGSRLIWVEERSERESLTGPPWRPMFGFLADPPAKPKRR